MDIISDLKNKSILILGYGREGESSYKFLRHNFPTKRLGIADFNSSISNKIINDENIDFHTGNDYLNSLKYYDFVLKTPGISFKDIDIPKNCTISSQTDLFLQMYSKQIIGVTGTKGKSTTTSLIYHILKQCNKNVLIAGNIGKPLFDIINEIHNETIIVCEFSSHQLEFIKKGPKIAILLNIFQEHLDHYKSFTDYQMAKLNIALTQNIDDFLVIPKQNPLITSLISAVNVKSNIEYFSTKELSNCSLIENEFYIFNKKIGTFNNEIKLKGEHNALNIMASILACKHFVNDEKEIVRAIKTFDPLPHRMEFIGEFNGIKFYNDSIATIPEASLSAISALNNVGTIILGGFDRGISYDEFILKLFNSKLDLIIFTGEAGKRMMNIAENNNLSTKIDYLFIDNYPEIVKTSFLLTPKGKICLLSPAASSYDSFKNFEHRGDKFKELIVESSKVHLKESR